MARLLDDLLEVSRISRGSLELRRRQLEFSATLSAAIETARPRLEAKRHTLTVDLPDEPIILYADDVRLSQILSNLLTNAAKYTDAGGHIRVRATCESGRLIVSVRDDGIGISAEMLPKIFEMFSQAHAALTRAEGGLGIGLSLVRGLVELHGGTVEARSAGLGSGSEFIVQLPLETGSVAPPNEQAAATVTVVPRRVLVADDNADAADSLAQLLRLQGHQVDVARNGEEALCLAATSHPEIAVLDIGMPKCNGYEVARRIRAEDWGHELMLIAVTGWGHEEHKRQALAAGFDRHMTKPVDPEAPARHFTGFADLCRPRVARSQ